MNTHSSIRIGSKQNGFTLLEVILVLGLIGLMVASISFTVLGDNKEEEIEKEVRRLQVLFNLASDYAVINQIELGLRIDDEDQSYEFVAFDDNEQWVPISQLSDQHIHFDKTILPEGVYLELMLDGFSWQEDDSLFDNRIFDENLSVSNDSVSIGDEEEKEPEPPQIFILSSGEITPFELLISYQAQELDEESFEYTLQGEDTVPLRLMRPE